MSNNAFQVWEHAVRATASNEAQKFRGGALHDISMIAVRILESIADKTAPYELPEEWGGMQDTIEAACDAVCRKVSELACQQMSFCKDLTEEVKREVSYVVDYGGTSNLRQLLAYLRR